MRRVCGGVSIRTVLAVFIRTGVTPAAGMIVPFDLDGERSIAPHTEHEPLHLAEGKDGDADQQCSPYER